jgi:hypothetical protein
MISIQAKKHDDFSVEFKFGFNTKEDGVKDNYSVNAWMSVPNSLDINPENYGKKQFYRDIKSNVRLITPVYLLREIAQDTSQPLVSLKAALENVVADGSRASLDAVTQVEPSYTTNLSLVQSYAPASRDFHSILLLFGSRFLPAIFSSAITSSQISPV